MKKVKQKFSDWESGRNFMNEVAKALNTEIEEQDAKLVIEGDGYDITCQLYFDGDAFALLKYEEDKFDAILQPIVNKYHR